MCKFVCVLLPVCRQLDVIRLGKTWRQCNSPVRKKPNFDSTNQLFVQESAALLGLWRCQMDGSRKRTYFQTASLALSRFTIPLLPRGQSHLARILVSFRQAASHHLATFTLKVTVLVPPAFLMTNLYCPSFSGVNLTEHFGPDESSLATSAPVES